MSFASQSDLIGLAVGSPALAEKMGYSVGTKAGAGTAQTGATALAANSINALTTSGGATAFVLPTGAPGDSVVVNNQSATTALVFPNSGAAINGGSTDASVSIAQNKTAIFIRYSSTVWFEVLTA